MAREAYISGIGMSEVGVRLTRSPLGLTLDAVREGDGTLLDNSLVLAYSDTGYARTHALDNIPMFLAGAAGGRHKTGRHVRSAGDPVTRVSLTAQQMLGLPVGSFGQESQKTSKPISEVMKA